MESETEKETGRWRQYTGGGKGISIVRYVMPSHTQSANLPNSLLSSKAHRARTGHCADTFAGGKQKTLGRRASPSLCVRWDYGSGGNVTVSYCTHTMLR